MAFPAGARVGTSSSSRPFSLLDTKSSVPNAGLSSVQKQVDGAVGSFADQVIDWKSMAAILAGTGAYRLGRMGIVGTGEGRILKALSVGAGLTAEVSAFEITQRSLASLTVSEEKGTANLWRWSGSRGLEQGLLSSLVTFGTLKGAGALTQGENIILRHASQDLGMVLGHQLAFFGGAGPKPQGSFAEQILEAEAVNLKLGAAMALIRRGPAEKGALLEFLRPSSKPFFPSILAAESSPSREGVLRSPWMLMVRDGDGGAAEAPKKPEPVPREMKEEELIRFAYDALEQWKKNPDTPFDYGKFFLEAETELRRQPLSEAQKKKVFQWYERRLSSHKTALFSFRNYGRNDVEREIRRYLGLSPDFQKQAVSLAHQYTKTFIFHSDDKANMSDFALCGRGSCSARAKFVLSTGTAADLPLPKNLKWAVQMYHEHVESVLYDETAEQIWVLSSGRVRIVDKIDASLYHPAIYFHGLLKRMGVASPVSERDLLLLEIPPDPDAELEPFSGGGNSPFELPSSSADFKGGETFWGHAIQLPGPELSWLPRSRALLFLAGAAFAASFFQKREKEIPVPDKKEEPPTPPPKKPEPEKFNKAVLWTEAMWTSSVTMQEILGKSPAPQIQYVGFYLPKWGGTILEKSADIADFNALSSSEEKYNFLVKVARRKEEGTDFKRGSAFLSNPVQNLREASPVELVLIASYLSEIEEVHKTAGSQLIREFSSKSDASSSVLIEKLQSSSLPWSTFYYNLNVWKKWIEEHPKEFLSLINEMPLEKKSAALDLPFAMESARKIVRNGKLNSTKTKDEETRFNPDRGPRPIEAMIELDANDISLPTSRQPISPVREKIPILEDEIPSDSSLVVSEETALTFGLKAGLLDKKILDHWSFDSTQTFLKLNKNGRFDQVFLRSLRTAKGNRLTPSQLSPELQRIFDDISRRNPKAWSEIGTDERIEGLMKQFVKNATGGSDK